MDSIRPLSTAPAVAPASAARLRALASSSDDVFEPGAGRRSLIAAGVGGAVAGSAALGFGTAWFRGATEVLSGLFHGSVVGAAVGAGLGAVVASVVAGPAEDGKMGSIGTALVGGALGGVSGLVSGAFVGAYVGTGAGNVLGFAAGAVLGGGAGYLVMRGRGARL